MVKSYLVTRDTQFFEEGDVVYEFLKYDYGCARDDEYVTGKAHTSVTSDPSGDYPFRTIPTSALEEITGLA